MRRNIKVLHDFMNNQLHISCMLVLLIYEIYIMIYVISTMGCNLSPILQWVLWDAYTYDSQL